MQQEFGPEIWSRLYARLNDGTREQLDRNLADPKYQLEVRKTIWAELDIDISTVEIPQHLRRGMNGHKEIATNA
jgi:hypothetical protein